MSRVTAWFAANGVAANLLMWLIVIVGLTSLFNLPKEIFPEVPSGLITVSVPYLGAAPEEVEEAVCARIEERLQDLQDVKRIRSIATEGSGLVTLELLSGADAREVLDEVKTRVDAIDSFPEETEKPLVQEVFLRNQVLSVAISGATDELTLRHLGERVRDGISALDGVTLVQLVGSRPYEISIEVSELALRRYGLSIDDVADAVRRSSVDLPGGSIRAAGGEILLRTEGQAFSGREFEELILTARSDGTRLTLGQVAAVVDGFADSDRRVRFDGQPAVLVQVFRVGNQDVTSISDRVKAHLESLRPGLPEGLELTVWKDDSRLLRSRIEALLDNGVAGLVLVLAVLALFLKLRLAFWVSAGIAVSFLGAFGWLWMLDVTINVHSVFAFIIALGIVVDDAIVVGENIYRHREMGRAGLDAAVRGVDEVAVPVGFSVLTTVAAFLPLTMIPGSFGEVLRVIPLVVIGTLLVSLVESMLILPRHLSHLGAALREPAEKVGWRRVQQGFLSALDQAVDRIYRPILSTAISWRYGSVALGGAALMLTVALVPGGRLGFSFFPPVEADNLVAFLTMPQGSSPQMTAAALERLERGAYELQSQLEELGESEVIRHVLTSIGEQPSLIPEHRFALQSLGSTSHFGEVNVELAPAEERRLSATELNRRWRQLTGPIPDAVELTFEASLISTGAAIDVQLQGPDLEDLQMAAAELEAALMRYPGVHDVANSLRRGKRELRLAVTPQAESLGVSLADLARQVRQAFYGEEVQRIQRGREEVKVLVRFPERERRSVADLEEMRIRTSDGGEVPFSVAGRKISGRGLFSIERTDRQRTVNVTADVDPEVTRGGDVLADLQLTALAEILARYRGMSYTLEGLEQVQRDTMGGLLRGFAFALFVIYALLAVAFASYLQPFLVISAIPFGIIGAFWGHVLMGEDLSVASMFGIVALTGVVVNDSLVLVDFINRESRGGEPLFDAIRKAGERRFRPIVLTSVTTFAGLTPLLLENDVQAQFLIPMAISLAFGVLFATVITLVLVPVAYVILEDLKRLAGSLARWPAAGDSRGDRSR